ncbi:MAG: GNAT family N-acetyltransferase [Alphaproteobacteria bacterium]|nr:GNAT family N-acetyltransferase [Alphaproteobacteria bacterium]
MYNLRKATMDDRETVFQLKKLTLYNETLEKRGKWDDDFERARAAESFSADYMFMIELNGAVIGSVGLEECEGYYRLRQFFLRPEYQGQGIGSRVITDFIKQVAGHPMRLKVGKPQHLSIKFYRKHGFAVIEDEPTDFIMERQC